MPALRCLARDESGVCRRGGRMGLAPASTWDPPTTPRGCGAGTELLARGEPSSRMGRQPSSQLGCGCGTHQSLARGCWGWGRDGAAESAASDAAAAWQRRAVLEAWGPGTKVGLAPPRRRQLRGMLCSAAGCPRDALGFSRHRVPGTGSTSLGEMRVPEPGWGRWGTFPAGKWFGTVQISAPHEEERCAVSRSWGHPVFLIFPPPPNTHMHFAINRAAHKIFLALLQSSRGELSGLPAALRSALGICTSPGAGG